MKTTNTRPQYDGVKFYSKGDMSIGWNLKKAEDRIPILSNKTTTYSINEILEMYNILKLFNTDSKLTSWDDNHYQKLKNIVYTFNASIGRFVSSFDYLQLNSTYMLICIDYINDFWDMFVHYKMYNKIPQDVFKEFLYSDSLKLRHILSYKELVNYFDSLISEYMLDNNCGAELLISEYLVQHDNEKEHYFFPHSLSSDSKKNLILSYINSENPNPNYLDMIVKGKQCNELKLDDKIRLAAKRKYDTYWNNHFAKNKGISIGAIVTFIDTDEPISVNLDDPLNPSLSFSSTWISENLDYPTLMNNFIYLFGFVDIFNRSTLPLKKYMNNSIESLIGLKSKKAYPVTTSYNLLESISTLETAAYDAELSKYSIRIEELLKWFFESYLKNEFNVDGFFFNTSSKESTYLEKCRHLCSELDSILKQFNTFVDNNYIDRDLVEMSSFTPHFSQIKSFCTQKYGYLQDNTLLNASNAFFSDQSLLTSTELTKTKYDTFFDLLANEKIGYNDLFEHQKPIIDILLKEDLLYYDSDYNIHFNSNKLIVLKDCYFNECLCPTYYKNTDYINSLISSNKLIIENTLFSRYEQDYLDYMLNDHSFDNGQQLRNKYAHGSNSLKTQQHKKDYYKFLKLFVLVVLKINEEFCRRDDTWDTKE